jgi:hypothetical protein
VILPRDSASSSAFASASAQQLECYCRVPVRFIGAREDGAVVG